jgi:hypothetical protein
VRRLGCTDDHAFAQLAAACMISQRHRPIGYPGPMPLALYALTSSTNGGNKFPVWVIVVIAVLIAIVAIAQVARRNRD